MSDFTIEAVTSVNRRGRGLLSFASSRMQGRLSENRAQAQKSMGDVHF
ncbi:hypothetical protein GGQ87_001980 [Brevundimonas alba]|uniref:Uncharacterized protein n=1 Tax=Brevundimonas alba TaxID=74314 RepID=A0A7X6BNT7_9CAUL|nr:hypothetical protein [Brevundimonas alba]NJC41722.1 hypothetical protein [Brevundimonas alba]